MISRPSFFRRLISLIGAIGVFSVSLVAFQQPQSASAGATYSLASNWTRDSVAAGDGPLVLGVRITTTEAGNITALKYFRDVTNAGPHTGSVWDSSGNLLASQLFTNETASGWQQVTLTNPVSVAAGATFTVGYSLPSSGYVRSSYPVTTIGPLTIHQGVYNYTGSADVVTNFPSASAGTNYMVDLDFVTGSDACIPATSTSAGDSINQFTTVGTCNWTIPAGVTNVRYLVVAGGGGGGSDNGGGGGAGGFVTGASVAVIPGETVSVAVGGGGAGAVNNSSTASRGGNSRFASIVALGGGGGGSIDRTEGGDGGSAGGRAANRNQVAEAAITTTSPLQGNNGGGKNSGGFGGGGGGGANAVGNNGGSNIGGNGGNGKQSDITGTNTYFAGGGGGGGDSNTAGTGGLGGGGNGSQRGDASPTVGVHGLGGGGGGAGGSVAGGLGARGGSGIVVIRYTVPAAPVNSAAPTISGTNRVGETLTATSGSWSGSPTSYSFQWKRASTTGGAYSNIGSASSSSTYVLTDEDVDKFIKVSVIATNGLGSSSAELSVATTAISDLPASTTPAFSSRTSTATGFTFTITNYSNLYSYTVTTSSGSVTRVGDDVTVTGLAAGASATVTVRATRSGYLASTAQVSGTAIPAVTTTTVKAAVTIDIQAPVTTVAQGQASVATIAPGAAQSASTASSTTSTVAPARSTVATTTTLSPVLQTRDALVAPKIPAVKTGESALDLGGVKEKVAVTRENNQLIIKSGALSARLSGLGKNGSTSPLDKEGNLQLEPGDIIRINVGGFKPESKVDVWFFSTPAHLGSTKVGADGTVSGAFRVPMNAKDGPHRIAVTAKLDSGKEATFTLGVRIGAIPKTSTLTRILIAIPIMMAIGAGLILPNQIRRRRRRLV